MSNNALQWRHMYQPLATQNLIFKIFFLKLKINAHAITRCTRRQSEEAECYYIQNLFTRLF